MSLKDLVQKILFKYLFLPQALLLFLLLVSFIFIANKIKYESREDIVMSITPLMARFILESDYANLEQILKSTSLSSQWVRAIVTLDSKVVVASFPDKSIIGQASHLKKFDASYVIQSKWGQPVGDLYIEEDIFGNWRFMTMFLTLVLAVLTLTYVFVYRSVGLNLRRHAGDIEIIKNSLRSDAPLGVNPDNFATIETKNIFKATNEFKTKILNSARVEVENMQNRNVVNLSRQVAHDIRSPLTALDMLAAEIKFTEPEKRTLFNSSIRRIREIANDLIKSKYKYDERDVDHNLENVKFDLSAALQEVVNEKVLLLGGSDIKLDLIANFENRQVMMPYNESEFKRCLSNLLQNAIDALNGAGLITVGLIFEGEYLKITVTDNGVGIDPKDLPNIFDIGYTKGKSELADAGSGLGLNQVRKFVDSAKGKLDVKSEPGQGTVVSIYLLYA